MDRTILDISSLFVTVEEKPILKGLDLHINEAEVHILFGPNGSGKSTLLSSLMQLPGYSIQSGEIKFKDQIINELKTDEIAKMGIGLSFQHPPAIHGVTLSKFLEKINQADDLENQVKELALEDFLYRDLNTGFSGGELKRAEILKLYAQNPDLVLIDEPESGVDLENIAIIAKAINKILQYDKPCKERKKSALIITHTGHILDYVEADIGHIIIDGKIVCSGNPRTLMHAIKQNGYSSLTTKGKDHDK